jgi:hypothetical protein
MGEVSPTSEHSVPVKSVPGTSPTPPATRPAGEGKAYFAVFLGICALGVSLFNLYHSMGGSLLDEVLPGVQLETPSPVSPQEVVTSKETAVSPAPTPIAEIPSVSQAMEGKQRVQWLALSDLQFARHDLLLGLNSSAEESLVLAKIHLSMLGEPYATETTALDRIISNLKETSVLSLGQLDSEIENLKDAWLRVTFGTTSQGNGGLLSWLWGYSIRQVGRTELETTDEGRYLVARLDRLKWLALWGDERGFRRVGATLETFLGPEFLKSPEAKQWQRWIRELQRIPLRHDVSELNTLIVRLSRMEMPP